MSPSDTDADRVSGTLILSDRAVEYSRAGVPEWRVPCDRIAVVGEFTDSSLGDDYFLLFITPAGECFQASIYAVGRDACLATLAEQFGSPLELALCNSTEFRSRVLWPPSLLGRPLLEPNIPQPKGLLARAAYRLGRASREARLSESVRAHLEPLIPTRHNK